MSLVPDSISFYICLHIPIVMARTISVSDEVYEKMKRMKKERSFSELIKSMMRESNLEELEGIGFSKDWEKVEEEIGKASDRTLDKIEKRYS